MANQIFATDNGKKFNITLDPGYCFAMSLDLAKVIEDHIKNGRPAKIPNIGELSPGKWAIVQSAYEINQHANDVTIIEAQGLQITASIPERPSHRDFASVAQVVTDVSGTSVFSISNNDESHAMLWYRDDTNGLYLFLDPNSGLWQVSSVGEGKTYLQNTFIADYDDLDEYYDYYTVSRG
jgi:hypothetical protein